MQTLANTPMKHLQLVKLSSVDAAGRQFMETSNFSKQSFLLTYGGWVLMCVCVCVIAK